MSPDTYLDALLSLPALDAAAISPDGRWAAWTWFRAGPTANVYAAPTDGSSEPIRLTETPHDTILTAWTPDSRAVLVAQDRPLIDHYHRQEDGTWALRVLEGLQAPLHLETIGCTVPLAEVYDRLGYVTHGPFIEGPALRRAAWQRLFGGFKEKK